MSSARDRLASIRARLETKTPAAAPSAQQAPGQPQHPPSVSPPPAAAPAARPAQPPAARQQHAPHPGHVASAPRGAPPAGQHHTNHASGNGHRPPSGPPARPGGLAAGALSRLGAGPAVPFSAGPQRPAAQSALTPVPSNSGGGGLPDVPAPEAHVRGNGDAKRPGEDAEELRRRVAALEEENKRLREGARVESAGGVDGGVEVEQLRQEVAELTLALERAENDKAKHQRALKALKERMLDLEQDEDRVVDERVAHGIEDALRAHRDASAAEQASLSAQVAAATQRCEALAAELAAATANVAVLRAALEERESEVANLQAALGALTASSDASEGLRSELWEARTGREAAEARCRELEEELRVARGAVADGAAAREAAERDAEAARSSALAARREAAVAQRALQEALRRLTAVSEGQGDTVDRALVRQLVVTHFKRMAGGDSHAFDVLASLLGLTEADRAACGVAATRGGVFGRVTSVAMAPVSLVKAVGNAAAAAKDEESGQAVGDIWVDFLMKAAMDDAAESEAADRERAGPPR
ncbi:unnamed protein product [Pedinophyceae sp. YPF-701]|nr:unnamed protein product [Pedinophyceae sp. YPF-701]